MHFFLKCMFISLLDVRYSIKHKNLSKKSDEYFRQSQLTIDKFFVILVHNYWDSIIRYRTYPV